MKILFFSSLIGLSLSCNPRSVSLAVETSLVFEPNDVRKNTSILNNIKTFIDNLQRALTNDDYQLRAKEENANILTSFLYDLGKIVLNYDENLFNLLKESFTKFHSNNLHKRFEFIGMFPNIKLRSFFKNTFKEWSVMKTDSLKKEIKKFMDDDGETAVVLFFKSLNRFFDEKDARKLYKILYKFKHANEENISDAFGNVITFMYLDKYLNSNQAAIAEFQRECDKFALYISEAYKSRVYDEELNSKPKKVGKAKEIKNTFPGSDRKDINVDLKDSLEKKTKIDGTKKKTNDIVVNKNIEVFVSGTQKNL
ncbi:hypothetical protein K1T71_000711 [Dendrolimus kikuchii]|uniref:Uncharacterized protein n=1 Tax=Dendrolimus kikuchii TaxID=765133 RepID=A0ACC1DKN1_9NEOP|nr:hypothetical protein K1T71_000711 [Dendrolimus kikuchii]